MLILALPNNTKQINNEIYWFNYTKNHQATSSSNEATIYINLIITNQPVKAIKKSSTKFYNETMNMVLLIVIIFIVLLVILMLGCVIKYKRKKVILPFKVNVN